MNSKKIIPVVAGVIAILLIISYTSLAADFDISENSFSYSDVDVIRDALASDGIFMSDTTLISDDTVKQYCMFFDENNNQKIMEYCLTSALTDFHGSPIGNVNFGGDSKSPQMALALIETQNLDSDQKLVTAIFETLIETLVCDCWDDKHPGGFESVSSWIDASKNYYADSEQKSTTSKISGLEGKYLILEITRTNNSYLWTLVIVK